MTAAPADRPPVSTDLGRTGRGLLSREGDRLVRVLDPRLCDERFRTAQAELRGRQPPGTLPIVADGPARDGYRIEYAAPAGFRTLGEAYAAAGHWHRRLLLAARVCEALAGWHHGRLATLGLDPHSVVLTGDGDSEETWLAPCPPVRVPTPRDLFGLDPESLAALAPEVVRGLAPHQRAEDAYALGTLAALALGCRPAATRDGDAGRVERQARDALLDVSAARSAVEPALRPAERLTALVRTVRLYRNRAPDARPPDAADLRRALLAAADLIGLAEDLWAGGDPVAALAALAPTGWPMSANWLAGRIHAATGDGPAAFAHYAEAVRQSPTQFRLRRERLDDLGRRWGADPEAPPEWADALLADIAYLQRFSGSADGPDLSLLEAEIYRRTGDDQRRMEALHAAAERAPGSLDILFRYASALRERGAHAEAAQAKALALRRIATMMRIPGAREEAQKWRARFDEL
jgi:hypothetical protein